MFAEITKAVENLLFPAECILCKGLTNGPLVCCECIDLFCSDQLVKAGNCYCKSCGEPTDSLLLTENTCLVCSLNPLPVRYLRSLYLYSKHTDSLVKAFKYSGNYQLTNILVKIIVNNPLIDLFDSQSWDIIIPLPSSCDILRSRGYSHTVLIAKKLSNIWHIPLSLFALTCTRKRSAQATLHGIDRHENMKMAFYAKNKLVAGKRILLFDDVVTSGATISEAATTLIRCGASQVDALTILRSENLMRNRLESQMDWN